MKFYKTSLSRQGFVCVRMVCIRILVQPVLYEEYMLNMVHFSIIKLSPIQVKIYATSLSLQELQFFNDSLQQLKIAQMKFSESGECVDKVRFMFCLSHLKIF